MRCKNSREWLSLELDGRLPPDRTIPLEDHLAHCEDCRAYRADLQLGGRLLRATEPRLAENFEWRLQLKLNQTLQEMARQATLPWEEPTRGPSRWLRNFGISAAAGLAFAIAVAFFTQPESPHRLVEVEMTGSKEPAAPTQQEYLEDFTPRLSGDPTRRSLIPTTLRWGPASSWQTVRLSEGGQLFDRSPNQFLNAWANNSLSDLRTITALRDENQRLRYRLIQVDRELVQLKRQLDTLQTLPVDPVKAND